MKAIVIFGGCTRTIELPEKVLFDYRRLEELSGVSNDNFMSHLKGLPESAGPFQIFCDNMFNSEEEELESKIESLDGIFSRQMRVLIKEEFGLKKNSKIHIGEICNPTEEQKNEGVEFVLEAHTY